MTRLGDSNIVAVWLPPSMDRMRISSSAKFLGLRCPASSINCWFILVRVGISAPVATRCAMAGVTAHLLDVAR
jgi:hypothetical protein